METDGDGGVVESSYLRSNLHLEELEQALSHDFLSRRDPRSLPRPPAVGPSLAVCLYLACCFLPPLVDASLTPQTPDSAGFEMAGLSNFLSLWCVL